MKDKRLKIGILTTYFDQHWTGGFIYAVNLINSLNRLDEADRPHIVLFYNERSEGKLDHINYPYLSYQFLSTHKSNFTTYLYSWFQFKNLFVKDIIVEHQLDGLYPLNDFPGKINNPNHHCRIVSWYPDYQQKFYPEYFSKLNLFFRELRIRNILRYSTDLVQSSYDAYSHLQRFFKYNPDKIRIHILQFVSLIDGIPNNNKDFLLEKYNITQPYFIVSNQFYKHKNHIVVYEAIKSLRDEWKDFQVVLTGKEEDYRNPGYITQLKELVKNNELEEHVRTLGVIPRADQLGLMKYSTAVIQPSKFEGWSTVVEDAKSLQKQILLSNIAVHIEQMNENAYYFEPDSSEQLKTLMLSLLKGSIVSKPILENYEDRIRLFAHSFISIFKK
jgi:glycosyltransferase involved in cell wall biosynthesis